MDVPERITMLDGSTEATFPYGAGPIEYIRADIADAHVTPLQAALALPEVRELVEAARPYVSPVQNGDFARQLRQHDALVAALAKLETGAGDEILELEREVRGRK